jgi:hypothetical protein
MKKINIIIAVVLLAIVAELVVYKLNVGSSILGGISSNTCTASTTAWSVGPEEVKAILPARANRLTFALTVTGVNTTGLYRLDSSLATATMHIKSMPLTASTTTYYDEDFPYRGAITAGAAASTTLIVTECLY